MERSGTAGWGEILSGGQALRVALVCFGVWLHAADELLIATLIPSIVRDLGGAPLIAWAFALYEIGSIVAGAASALIGHRFGLGRAMSLAALTYLVGCAISALAPEMTVLLAGRLLQGLGGGGMVALSFVAVGRLFPRRHLARVMAAVSAVWGISAFLGPLVGGLFAEIGFWRGGFWAFAVQAGLLALWVRWGLRDEASSDAEKAPARLPLRRLACLSAGVVAIAAAGIRVSALGSPLLILAGLALLALFLWLDGRAGADRLLPPRPFGLKTGLGAGLTLVLCFSAATIGFSLYGPVVLTLLHGVSALTAGYLVALASIGWSLAAIAVSGAAERHDRTFILLGMGLLTLSVIGFMGFVAGGPIWAIALVALLEGAGFGMAWTFILRRGIALAPRAEQDRLASALPTVQRLGYALGAAGLGIVANAAGFQEGLSLAAAERVGFWVFAAAIPVAALGLVATWRFVRPASAGGRR